MSARDVILKPIVSEKSYALIDENSYTFLVHPDANKVQIRQAVEEIWGVKVLKVNTQNRNGKVKATRMGKGRRNNTRRAIVKLAEGDKIELFETR
ncbi:MAG: 50S ribosomal protein L23 [Actinomycetota bacterium]